MSKFQITVLVLLGLILCAIFGGIGLVGVFLIQANPVSLQPPPSPPTAASELLVNPTPTSLPTETPRPTNTPEPYLADFDDLVTRFEYNHKFNQWDTAPGVDLPILIGKNEEETASIRIYGNPVKRVTLELDYELSGNGAAPYINDVIDFTLPEEYQNDFVEWFRSNPDAERDERQFGDRTVTWSALPDYWMLKVQLSELD